MIKEGMILTLTEGEGFKFGDECIDGKIVRVVSVENDVIGVRLIDYPKSSIIYFKESAFESVICTKNIHFNN
ncbi:hypothetical protein [Terrisporobacter sp.]|uniref:hypothetical protein n=1 Tax=Terrisporobacter sp. TaxID=1965305 RepID=UPI002896300A|nr:hypothetical protein [Terrisporobacter sp.]